MQHIAYKGGAPAMTKLLGGNIELIFDGLDRRGISEERKNSAHRRHLRKALIAVP